MSREKQYAVDVFATRSGDFRLQIRYAVCQIEVITFSLQTTAVKRFQLVFNSDESPGHVGRHFGYPYVDTLDIVSKS